MEVEGAINGTRKQIVIISILLVSEEGRLEPEFPDTVCLQNPCEMETGWGLLTGLDVLPEQCLVLSGLKIGKLLELE